MRRWFCRQLTDTWQPSVAGLLERTQTGSAFSWYRSPDRRVCAQRRPIHPASPKGPIVGSIVRSTAASKLVLRASRLASTSCLEETDGSPNLRESANPLESPFHGNRTACLSHYENAGHLGVLPQKREAFSPSPYPLPPGERGETSHPVLAIQHSWIALGEADQELLLP